VIWEGVEIARTTKGYRVLETSHPPTYYFPEKDVKLSYLDIRMDDYQTQCVWKGEATYYDLVAGDKRSSMAAWQYKDPNSELDQDMKHGYQDFGTGSEYGVGGSFGPLKGYIAFFPSKVSSCYVAGELVLAQGGDFYGGWITSWITGGERGIKGGPSCKVTVAEPAKSSPQAAAALFRLIDVNDSGSISELELMDFLLKRGMEEQRISELFAFVDTDGTGYISKEEWAQGYVEAAKGFAGGPQEKPPAKKVGGADATAPTTEPDVLDRISKALDGIENSEDMTTSDQLEQLDDIDRWFGAWRNRLDVWWAMRPESKSLQACLGAVSVLLAKRLERWIKTLTIAKVDIGLFLASKKQAAAQADPEGDKEQCDELLAEDGEKLGLPDFPDPPDAKDPSKFLRLLPPVPGWGPRLLPQWHYQLLSQKLELQQLKATQQTQDEATNPSVLASFSLGGVAGFSAALLVALACQRSRRLGASRPWRLGMRRGPRACSVEGDR